MKKLSSIMVAFAACVMMLTSCLDGDSSYSSPKYGYGVVKFDTKSMRSLLYFSNNDYPIYSANLSGLMENTCVSFYAVVHIDKENNTDLADLGYYLPTSFDYGEIGSSYLSSMLPDTTKALENELTLKQFGVGNYVEEHLFVGMTLSENKPGQKNNYILAYGDTQPEVINGKRIYNLYFRANKIEDGKNGTETDDSYGFVAGSFIKMAHQQEKEAKESTINIRVHYVSELDETDKENIKIKKWSYVDMNTIQFSDAD